MTHLPSFSPQVRAATVEADTQQMVVSTILLQHTFGIMPILRSMMIDRLFYPVRSLESLLLVTTLGMYRTPSYIVFCITREARRASSWKLTPKGGDLVIYSIEEVENRAFTPVLPKE